jgi:hypothetical protein
VGPVSVRLEDLSLDALIRRIQNAPDFGYDDEAVELNRRLALRGQTWKWSEDFFNPSIVIVNTGVGAPTPQKESTP